MPKSVAAVAALVILLGPVAPGVRARQAPDLSALDAVVVEAMRASKTPGAAVAVVLGDRVVYAKGFGTTSVEGGPPVTAETLFRIGSTTKMMTAAAVVTAAARGKLGLHTPLGAALRGLPPRLSAATLDRLLSHSAGLRDFAAPSVSGDESSLAPAMRTFRDDVFFGEPGAVYSYSSPGYWLAGAALEAATGAPYADAMAQLLFEPLGMKRTTFRPLVAMTYPLALPHEAAKDGAAAVVRPAPNNTVMWPAGSMYSSAADLSRFAVAFLNGGRLDGAQALDPRVPAELGARHTALAGGDGTAFYGYGLLGFKYRGLRVLQHGGVSRGYGAFVTFVPDRGLAVIVLTNRNGATLPAVTDRAIELALGGLEAEASMPKPVLPMTAAEAARYAGVYENAPQTWELVARDGNLILKSEGEEATLVKIGEGRFTPDPKGDDKVVLVPGPSGPYEYLSTGLYAGRRKGS